MKSYKNNKASLSTEMMVAIVAIIFIAIVWLYAHNYSSNTKEQYEKMAPELTYQFPAVFTHAYLMTPLTKEEKTELTLDINEQYFVKDLLILGTTQAETILENKRIDFIKEYSDDSGTLISPLSSFQEFSKKKFTPDKLLCYFTEKTQAKDLEDEIIIDNYFFYVKNMNDEYAYVRFNCG